MTSEWIVDALVMAIHEYNVKEEGRCLHESPRLRITKNECEELASRLMDTAPGRGIVADWAAMTSLIELWRATHEL